MLEIAVVENTSRSSVKVDNLLGGMSTQTGLRVATSTALTRLANSGDVLSGNGGVLPPGGKILIPLRMLLGPDQITSEQFGYRQTSASIHQRIGANGFKGNTEAFGAPDFATYVYGPEIGFGGLTVNGNRIDLVNRSANFMEITMSQEEGSCPHLLSHDEKDLDWTDHGKVLHDASARDREYTEVKVFSGFRGHFRLEEREPEVALIDQAELVVTLADGEILILKPDNRKLAARDGDYLRMFWGDSAQIEFTLPKSVTESSVIESRLGVTGYYLRYANLIARQKSSDALTVGRRAARRLSSATSIPGTTSRIVGTVPK